MKWQQYLLGFAEHAALKSKDSTQVGAALVGPCNEVLLTGFNGPPIGVGESEWRRERPQKYRYVSHAEQNLVAFAARHGIKTDGCSVYVTHPCCSACTKTLIQAGIKTVFIGSGLLNPSGGWEEDVAASREMFAEAGVKVVNLG